MIYIIVSKNNYFLGFICGVGVKEAYIKCQGVKFAEYKVIKAVKLS